MPPVKTLLPLFFRSSDMMVVVVVLPSEPVTPMVMQGQRDKKTSISEVITTPLSLAFKRAGTSGLKPGVRKIMSPVTSER